MKYILLYAYFWLVYYTKVKETSFLRGLLNFCTIINFVLRDSILFFIRECPFLLMGLTTYLLSNKNTLSERIR